MLRLTVMYARESALFRPQVCVVAQRQRSTPAVCAVQLSIKMRNMRRKGSAAPHSNWSPTVNAPT
jgi:hypothetical protein